MTETIFTYPLIRPIQAHGEELTELRYRAATGKDMVRCGRAFRMNLETGEITIVDETKAMKYMAVLANVPPSSIEALEPMDILTLMEVLPTFLVPKSMMEKAAPAGSTSTNSSSATTAPPASSGTIPASLT